MEELLKKLKSFIDRNRLIPESSNIGVGVSGGPDSIFLLFMLNKIKEELNLNLTVLHFNHKIREEADEEELFVKDMAEKMGLNFVSKTHNVIEFKKEHKLSLEEAARIKRREFFLKAKKTLSLDFIATGHTMNDAIETMLMHLIKGSSLDGLVSLKPKSSFFIRPILCFKKDEIQSFLDENNIEYKIDRSNFEEKYTRNKIRHKLIPLLEEFNPNITETLFRELNILNEDSRFLSDLSEIEFTKRVRIIENRAILNLDDLDYPSIRRRIISKAVKQLTGMSYSISFENLERINNIDENTEVHLRKIIKAYKRNGKLIIEKW